ncbi:MAG: hypothetical protein QXO70_00760 [Candidatus Pacearchaeota archaeon]
MVDEIRIYYESIEQGANYIKPIIENTLKKNKLNIDIKLVRLKGNYVYYSQNVAPIIFWKDPDILITAIIDDVEYPLLLIEFSNAVFTEDHELQRFDGLVASAENNCIYVKISPVTKLSQSEHGGNVDFDYIGPFSLILKKFGKLFYHFDWPCSDKGIVEVDKNYLSVPKEIKEFNLLVELLIKNISTKDFRKERWIIDFEKEVLNIKFFNEWKNKLNGFTIPEVSSLNSSRTEWISSKKEFILKLNRFGHAMDPERGMLAYYGTVYDKTISKMMFNDSNNAWYKDIPKENEIKNYITKNGLKKGYDFLYCFMLGSGLYNNDDFQKIVAGYKQNKNEVLEIDITNFLNSNYLQLSKSMRTIFKNSISLVVVDKSNNLKLKLVWKKFNKTEDYSSLPQKTFIKERTYFDEDDVTYITIHNVLKKNDFIILAVSYPGAQADKVVLIAPGTGRKQERRYIDIISYLPKKFTNLQENKGRYSPNEIQKEIDELTKYKTKKEYKEAINSFIDRFDSNAPKVIKIGVGFWANSKFTISKIKELDIRNLDYFVYLTSDRKEWFIWSTGKDNMFRVTNGNISICKTYEVVKEENNNTKFLSEFI